MANHLIFGAGPVGRATAALLVGEGHHVTIASRSGAGPQIPGARRVALDAADGEALTRATIGQAVLYNCLNPEYHRWPTDWPPMALNLLAAAERSGAVLLTASNLYGYGPVDRPMVEGQPDAATEAKGLVRARMWADALAAHRAGRIRTAEVRASDYLGPAVGAGSHLTRVIPALKAGKRPLIVGSPDQAHSWTDIRDVARTLVALSAAETALGRVWHVPSNPPLTQREVLSEVAETLGLPAPRPRVIRGTGLRILGVASPLLRELAGTAYQFEAPFVLDSSAAERELGIAPTPWVEVVRATASEN